MTKVIIFEPETISLSFISREKYNIKTNNYAPPLKKERYSKRRYTTNKRYVYI